MRIAGVLLAAGLSRRYGTADKLAAPLDGKPIGLRAARTLAASGVVPLIAVTGDRPLDYGAIGFTLRRNPRAEAGQGGSVAIGAAAAREAGVDGVLFALADMPLVALSHLHRILEAAGTREARVASIANGRVSPPALFGAQWFPALEALEGDRGARTLLDGAVLIPASGMTLADIDTPADLERLRTGRMA